jgi:anti-sigma-K factor RskA
MIPEQHHDNVPLYVLGEMDDAERVAFEVLLARSPELRQEVRACAEAMGALASEPGAPRELPPHVWAGIEQRLDAEAGVPTVVATTFPGGPRAERAAGNAKWWANWAWPVAAAFLLGLNFLQWIGRTGAVRAPVFAEAEGDVRGETDLARGGEAAVQSGVRTGDVGTGRSAFVATSVAEGEATDSRRGVSSMDELTEARGRAQRLAEDYRRLAREYDELAEAVLPLVQAGVLERTPPVVWTAELRSGSDVAAGAGTGLWDRAREVAPARGVAVLPDRWNFRSGGATAESPDVALIGGGMGAADTRGEAAAGAFAMVALNNEQGLGYLDVYNLPVTAPGTALQVWLQAREGGAFVALGAVPEVLAGGSGGLVFRIPGDAGDAARVVVTIEPSAGVAQPTGPVVLEGP